MSYIRPSTIRRSAVVLRHPAIPPSNHHPTEDEVCNALHTFTSCPPGTGHHPRRGTPPHHPGIHTTPHRSPSTHHREFLCHSPSGQHH
jgi:hypothetical protein